MKVQEVSRLCEDRVRWRRAIQSVICPCSAYQRRMTATAETGDIENVSQTLTILCTMVPISKSSKDLSDQLLFGNLFWERRMMTANDHCRDRNKRAYLYICLGQIIQYYTNTVFLVSFIVLIIAILYYYSVLSRIMIQYYGCLVWILSADGLSQYNIDTKQPFASNIDSKPAYL